MRVGAGLVIGNGLKVICSAKKCAQFQIKARLIFDQSPQFVLYAAMPLDDPAGALDDHRLRRMRPREVCRTPGLIGPGVGKHVLRVREKLAGLVEKGGGLRTVTDQPPPRAPSISLVRSL